MSKYLDYTGAQLEEHLSNFLVNSWSYSAVSQFARNQKAYERTYLYRERDRDSASSVAGSAYHAAIEEYFFAMREEKPLLDVVAMEKIVFDYIDNKPANTWKLQKQTPTMETAIAAASKGAIFGVKCFLQEISKYTSIIKRVIDVELKGSKAWISLNGVDIPLPCSYRIDLAVETNEGKIAIVDHKLKKTFTDPEEMKLVCGPQAIIYAKCYEFLTGLKVDEVHFMECKTAANKDGSGQIKPFAVILDDDTRKLYEYLAYEPLKAMIMAVNNPDYEYVMNLSDNLVDKPELFEFYFKTMIAEVEDFDIDPSKKELISRRLRKNRDASLASINPKVISQFKEHAATFIQYDLSNKNMTKQEKIEHVLRSFQVSARVAYTFEGYSSDTYLIEVGPGVKISSIGQHKLDIANALDVEKVRVSRDLVVHEKRSYVAVEAGKVRDRDLFFDKSKLVDRKIPLGEDNLGNTIVWDLDNQSTPHAMICGGTGSGKSVEINTIIHHVIDTKTKVVILDPKREFIHMNKGVDWVVNDIEEIERKMAELVDEMNALVKSGGVSKKLIVFDEFADAILNSTEGKALNIYEQQEVGMYKNGLPKTKMVCVGRHMSLEENLRLLVQKSRSVGFRILVAAQRVDTKVMTGNSKNNFPVRICFKVNSQTDSQVVLDEPGAEILRGRGDGLIRSPQYADITRFQAFYKP